MAKTHVVDLRKLSGVRNRLAMRTIGLRKGNATQSRIDDHLRTRKRTKHASGGSSSRTKTRTKRDKGSLLEATGIVTGKFNFSAKMSKTAAKIKPLSKPVIGRTNNSSSLTGRTGECRWLWLNSGVQMTPGYIRTLIDQAVMQVKSAPITGDNALFYTQVLLKWIKFTRLITNQTNATIELTWYECQAKRDAEADPENLAVAELTAQGAPTGFGNGTTMWGSSNLFDQDQVRVFYKKFKKQTYYLKPGETLKLYSNYHYNKMYNDETMANIPTGTQYLKGLFTTLFRVQGVQAVTNTGDSGTTTNGFKVGIVENWETCCVPYPFPKTAKRAFYDTTNLPQYDADDAGLIVMNEDVAQVFTEAIA